MPTSSDATSLISHTGWAYWPIAFIARLPFAMMIVGTLTFVVTATDSVALGGLTSAAVGIGTVIAGPVIGDLVDRHGQRVVLVPVGIANGILLAVFPVVVLSGWGEAAILAAGAAIGLSAPQAAAMSRSRLMAIILSAMSPVRRPRTFSRMMSYESAADETAFVIGPFLVGILASFVAPWAPLAIAGALTVVFVTWFALHPTARVQMHADDAGARAPVSALLSGRVLVIVAATFAVGLFFGATLTSLTAFAQEFGDGSEAGLLYGLMGIGSAVLALGVGLLPPAFTLRWRWMLFAAVLAAASIVFAVADGFPAVIVALMVMGLGVGPTLVTLFSLAGERAPVGRTATVMTVVGSALQLAQALAAAGTGAVAEATSARTSMVLPLVAAALVLVLGVVNAAIVRRDASAPALV